MDDQFSDQVNRAADAATKAAQASRRTMDEGGKAAGPQALDGPRDEIVGDYILDNGISTA